MSQSHQLDISLGGIVCDPLAPFDRCFLADTMGEGVPSNPTSLVFELAQFVIDSFPIRSAAPGGPDEALRTLSAMTELERQRLWDAFCDGRDVRPTTTLWILGVGMAAVGRYRLSAGLFLYGAALLHGRPEHPALLAKAGGTLNTAGHGRMAEPLLAGALATIRHTPSSVNWPAVVKLVVPYSLFHLARRQLFRDNLDSADSLLDQVEETLRAAQMELPELHDVGRELPEVLMLRARIARGRCEVAGKPMGRLAFELLDRAETVLDRSLFFPPFAKHHVMYQRAVALRLDGDVDRALAEARLAREAFSEHDASSAISGIAELKNTRREGYVYALLGDLHGDLGKHEEAIDCYRTAARLWSHPYYPRGVSRASRDHARCLIAMGRQWTEASRLLSEAITNARSIGCRGSEARAMAVRVALHRRLGHDAKASDADRKLSTLTRNSPDISWLLGRLRDGVFGRTEHQVSTSDDRGLGLDGIGEQSPAMRKCLGDLGANAEKSFLIVLGEPGLDALSFASTFHAQRSSGGTLLTHRYRPTGGASAAPPPPTGSPDSTVAVTGHASSMNAADLRQIQRWSARCPVVLCLESDEAGIQRVISSAQKVHPRPPVVVVPPLRERRSDIQALGQRFLSAELSKHLTVSPVIRSLSTDSWNYLSCYDWPGNVAQLRAAIVGLVRTAVEGRVKAEHVNADGELLLEFVAPSTANIWALAPRARSSEGLPTLGRGVPVTLDALRQLCTENSVQTVSEAARRLKAAYGYPGSVASLVRMLNRKRAFRDAVMEANGSRQ